MKGKGECRKLRLEVAGFRATRLKMMSTVEVTLDPEMVVTGSREKKKRALSLESVVPPHRLTVPGCPGPEQNALGHFGGTGIRVVPNLRHANGPWVSC